MPAQTTTSTAPTLHTSKPSPLTAFHRVQALLSSLAILALLSHRSLSLRPHLPSLLLLLADLAFASAWALAQAFRWRPIRRREFPENLPVSADLPPLDVFICTADPHKEPPAGVASTALSVMTFDYPADRLSVYVSDDGGSELTLFAFMEAARFARYWIPFCRENDVDVRSPEAYFGSGAGDSSDKMKMMYQTMKDKVERMVKKGYVAEDVMIPAEEYSIFKKWKKFTRHDHPSIIQVLVDSSKDLDIMGNPMPNLIYVSREKRPGSPHHFKGGALNALTRVSGVMTDAPVILSLDCDMYSNDPRSPLRALCYLLDPAIASKLAFVQFPQVYHGLNKSDIYGSELQRVFRINAQGMDGLHGPNYVGTGCFHARRSLYGPPPPSPIDDLHGLDSLKPRNGGSISSEPVLRMALQAASCDCEVGTKWGSMIGFRYGSLVEDFNTGYHLHCQGWDSVLCDPERPAFLGEAPKNLKDVLSQRQRWCVGLWEVGLSRFSPLTFGVRRASFLTGLCYAHYSFWGLWFFPLTIYALIPQLALFYRSPLFPEASDPWFYLYAYIFLVTYCQELLEFLTSGATTAQRWWSEQRMWMIHSITSFAFGTAQFALNRLGISAPGFNVTSKVREEEQGERYDGGSFYFGASSPSFVVLGTVAIVNLSSFAVGIVKAARSEGGFDKMFVQLFLSGFCVVNCWPVIEAMFLRRDGGRMPRDVTYVSVLLAALFYSTGCFMFAQ